MNQCSEYIKKVYKKRRTHICKYCKKEMAYQPNYGLCHPKCFEKHMKYAKSLLSISELEFFDFDKEILYEEIKRYCS